jgi:chemotaxis protein CheD
MTASAVHVIQGQQAVSDEAEATMQTVLGSCVSACLHDPVRRIGGMNHFLLPDAVDGTDMRYASAAMERLVNALLKRGAARERLEAKLFGGARIMASLPDIGRRNAEAALSFLQNEGIVCKSQSLGGEKARRVRFWPATGRAQQLLIEGQETVQNTETPRATARQRAGSIELF